MLAIQNTLFISIAFTVFLSSCGEKSVLQTEPLLSDLAPAGWADAASALVDNSNATTGYVSLAESPAGGILMRIDLESLSKGWHGVHLHQVADCTDFAEGFKLSGGHVDPQERQHGLLNPEGPEAADMPNIYAGADGRATAEIYNPNVSLFASEAAAAATGPNPLIDEDGFSIIVHQGADDHVTQPIGGAGSRVACAAIKSGL